MAVLVGLALGAALLALVGVACVLVQVVTLRVRLEALQRRVDHGPRDGL